MMKISLARSDFPCAEPIALTVENFLTEKKGKLNAAVRLTVNKTGTLVVRPRRLH